MQVFFLLKKTKSFCFMWTLVFLVHALLESIYSDILFFYALLRPQVYEMERTNQTAPNLLVHLSYNPYFSACFLCPNIVFLLQQIISYDFSAKRTDSSFVSCWLKMLYSTFMAVLWAVLGVWEQARCHLQAHTRPQRTLHLFPEKTNLITGTLRCWFRALQFCCVHVMALASFAGTPSTWSDGLPFPGWGW
jgi:hypothetical protein